jgi:hypothetical protein
MILLLFDFDHEIASKTRCGGAVLKVFKQDRELGESKADGYRDETCHGQGSTITVWDSLLGIANWTRIALSFNNQTPLY